MCSLIMSILLIAMFSIPAGAIETNLTQEEAREAQIQRYAYMDMEKASSADREKILKAREEIIYHSGGWYSRKAGALSAQEIDENFQVIRELPEFYELFPEDWDVPCSNIEVDSPSTDLDLRTLMLDGVAKVTPLQIINYNADTYLYNPSDASITGAFCTFSTHRGTGTPRVRAQAQRLYNSASYNIGFTNADNGLDVTYDENLPAGTGIQMTIPSYIWRLGVRASTYSRPGNALMYVDSVYFDGP